MSVDKTLPMLFVLLVYAVIKMPPVTIIITIAKIKDVLLIIFPLILIAAKRRAPYSFYLFLYVLQTQKGDTYRKFFCHKAG